MMKLTVRMNHTQHHTAVERNRISGSTQTRYHTYCMVGWGGDRFTVVKAGHERDDGQGQREGTRDVGSSRK